MKNVLRPGGEHTGIYGTPPNSVAGFEHPLRVEQTRKRERKGKGRGLMTKLLLKTFYDF